MRQETKHGIVSFLLLLVTASSAVAQAGIGNIIGNGLAESGIRFDPDTANNYAPKDLDLSQRRFADDEQTQAMRPIMEKARGETGSGNLGGSFGDVTRNTESVQDATSVTNSREQADRSANSEVATTQTLAMGSSKDGMLRTAVRLLDPALAEASTDAQMVALTTNNAQTLNDDRGDGPQYEAISECIKSKVNKEKMSEADARAKCEEELKGASGINGAPNTESSFLASHPAHPSRYGNFFSDDALFNAKDAISLRSLLTNRRIARISLSVGGIGPMGIPIFNLTAPTTEPNKSEYDAIKKALNLLATYGGSVEYKADGTKFVRSYNKPPKNYDDRYQKLLTANYQDLAWLTRAVCGFENRVDAMDQAPFRSVTGNIFGAQLTFALENDIMAYFRKNKMEDAVMQRLKNLSAGSLFAMTINYPVALNQLFINTERVIEEQQSDGGSQIKIKCDSIKATKDELDSYLKFLKEFKKSNSLSPRARYSVMLAHYITEAQLANEAFETYRILMAAYGYPKSDERFVENVEGQMKFVADIDLRVLLGNSMGMKGDPNPLQPFGFYYADAADKLKKITEIFAKDLDKARGISGSTLAGVTSTSGTGNPLR